jgi:alkylation response protein AidB-like acyl-CoA dehydrogenase
MNIPQAPCLTAFLLSTALPLSETGGETESAQDFLSWQRLAQRHYPLWPTPFERAVAGGFCSLNLGIAFTFGYQSALQAIAPGAVDYNAASFCVTESGGNKPSAVATTLTRADQGWSLTGQKSFVSGAEHARRLLVAASTGLDASGRNQLAMVIVDANLPGVHITPLPPLPFTPEISHGAVQFEQVPIGDERILPGDGYADYVKPFRTVEDIHVSSAILGYCLRVARAEALPLPLQEELLGLVWLHRILAEQSPAAAGTHLGLAGARSMMEQVLSRFEPALQAANPELGRIWARDKALLGIAAKARAQRTAKAWETLTGSPA